MKSIMFYLLAAMPVMFAMPAAAEGYEGFAPVDSEEMPSIVVVDDSPMLAERPAMRQLEAAVIFTKANDGLPGDEDEGLSYIAALSGKNLPNEVGWRR